ncbi:MAG: glycosyltransferase, partial [Thermoguttaceae bacterium]|nr:glycosyltransferase [Thermoguttaceae bacterium]
MSKSRVVIVTRTFWPLVGAAETAAARLAVGLVEAGWPVTVLTARWQKQWPSSIRFHDALVERLTPRPDGRWAEWRYQHAVGRWLRRRAATLGVVYVFDLRQEASTALYAVGRKVPVVLRVQAISRPTDCSPALVILHRLLTRHRAGAAALVCGCETTRQEIAAAGFPDHRIHVIPDGVATLSQRTTKTRADA